MRRSLAARAAGLVKSRRRYIVKVRGPTTMLRLDQLFSPKSAVAADARFLRIQPPIFTPIEVQPLGAAGQLPSTSIFNVRLPMTASKDLQRRLLFILHRGLVDARLLALGGNHAQLFDLADALEPLPGWLAAILPYDARCDALRAPRPGKTSARDRSAEGARAAKVDPCRRRRCHRRTALEREPTRFVIPEGDTRLFGPCWMRRAS